MMNSGCMLLTELNDCVVDRPFFRKNVFVQIADDFFKIIYDDDDDDTNSK